MKLNNMKVHQVPIDQLIPADYNPRQLTEHQFETIKDSLSKFGFVDPVIVNQHESRMNIIIGGHQRTRVAKEMGYKKVPCIFLKLTLEEERELNIRLNRNSGEWDWDALANNFDEEELIDFGFEAYELHINDGQEPVSRARPDKTRTSQGDLWKVGSHELTVGEDCVCADKLLASYERRNDDKAELISEGPDAIIE